MAKCKKCGKKGLFLKLNSSGICQPCDINRQLAEHEQSLKESILLLKQQYATQEAELKTRIDQFNSQLSDQTVLYNIISEKAKTDAIKSIEFDITKLREHRSIADNELSAVNKELNAQRDEYAKVLGAVRNNGIKLITLQNAYQSFKAGLRKEKTLDINTTDPNSMIFVGNQVEELLATTIELKLHNMDVKSLRKLFAQNKKLIHETLEKYKGRYTTKANISIYRLMVIALEAELQNILYNINYGKLDKAIEDIKKTTTKYLNIATDGNQAIAPTITRFIGEIEYLFIEAIKIEYEYYVQKERIREEQRAIREQIRQETKERKELELQRKQIEKEEEKFKNHLGLLNEQLLQTLDEEKQKLLTIRIQQLTEQLMAVEHKKDEIIHLQNGKAGYVYIISNLGSFGDKVFKIGMTRRLEPMERIYELGDASVPFPFDVHGMIFSDDAVGLEQSIHKSLNNLRLNKVNLRKEFFNISIQGLEDLVISLEPSAEFNRTLLAEQYYQSMSIDAVPDISVQIENDDNSEDDADAI